MALNAKKAIKLMEGLSKKYEIPIRDITHELPTNGRHPTKAYKFNNVVLLVFEANGEAWIEIYRPYTPDTISLILKTPKNIDDEIQMRKIIEKSRKIEISSIQNVVRALLWTMVWGFYATCVSQYCLPSDDFTTITILPDMYIKILDPQTFQESRHYIVKRGKFVKRSEFNIGAKMFSHFWNFELY